MASCHLSSEGALPCQMTSHATNEAVPVPIVRPTVHCLSIVVTMLLNIIMWGSMAIMLVTMVMVWLCATVLMLLVAIV